MRVLLHTPLIAALCLTAGCSLNRPGVPLDSDADPGMPDGAPGTADANPDSPDAPPPIDAPDGFDCADWDPTTTTYFDPCQDILPPSGPLTLSTGDWAYDTDAGQLTMPDGTLFSPQPQTGMFVQTGGQAARFISVESFTMETGSSLRVTGSLPLIVASWDAIAIDGDIDAGSRRDEFPVTGAGAMASCGEDAPVVGTDQPSGGGGHGGGGGGGGGYGSAGGNGGEGRNTTAGGAGGNPVSAVPGFVRGGCAGADGGAGSPNDQGMAAPGSPGGAGGGAIQLTARNRVTIQSFISAGGSGARPGVAGSSIGGTGGQGGGGGGGGGSGGFIGVEAPTVVIAGALYAQGGGGGEGNRNSTVGDPGDDAPFSMGIALGGSGTDSQGGDGGDGFPAMSADLDGERAHTGGGGGGGAGWIVLRGPMIEFNPANSSPTAVQVP